LQPVDFFDLIADLVCWFVDGLTVFSRPGGGRLKRRKRAQMITLTPSSKKRRRWF
jgi:hypothetical protein